MLYSLARPLLFSLEPETAHRVTLGLAEISARLRLSSKVSSCPVRVMGIDFPNPVGAAAGLDKHAEHLDAVAALGFGFVELGGVTPRPQPGNPMPRLFRLSDAGAIINRFGFNSVGVEAFTENLKRARTKAIIGVNLGKNRDTPLERAAGDYEHSMEVLYPHVHYLTINVSSPNTKGLRSLQSAAFLSLLLKRVTEKREALRQRHGRNVALVLKISPDIDAAAIRDIADVARRERADGLIATNTTVSREGVAALPYGKEEGGLSGAPLREPATRVLRAFSALLKNEIPLIGSGGIMSGEDAREKFDAGASLVQIYSGLVFRGPRLISECVAAYEASERSAH
jgi:dihydroorotate dehydrogenase